MPLSVYSGYWTHSAHLFIGHNVQTQLNVLTCASGVVVVAPKQTAAIGSIVTAANAHCNFSHPVTSRIDCRLRIAALLLNGLSARSIGANLIRVPLLLMVAAVRVRHRFH